MRIAYITTDLREDQRTYGETAPRFVPGHESLFEGLAAFPEAEVHIISCLQVPVQSPAKLANNIRIHSLHVPKFGWLRTGYQGCIRATRRKLKQIRPDIVHGHGTERDGAICAAFSGFPNVVTIQGNMVELSRLHQARFGSYYWLTARLENLTLPKTVGVFCNSAYTEELVRGRTPKTWLLPHAVRSDFFDPPPAAGGRPCVLLNAGVISPRKRQLELLGLAETLHRRGLKFEFRFIGLIFSEADAYARKFLERIKPMEEAGYARYLGSLPRSELVRCFDSVAGMVHFPTEEAFGNVVAESLTRELKFFGSRLGGIVDIAEGVPGAELFAKDDWSGLADAIARWMEQGHPRPTGAGILMRQRYHPEVIARRHLEIYREILNGRSQIAPDQLSKPGRSVAV
jgi:glycosyltransferase involved in cell wall biosynthesis